MVDDTSSGHMAGKVPDERRRIARQLGQHFAAADLPAAEQLAIESLARELVADSVERVRRELALAVRNAPNLPTDVALQLAHDVDSVATPFLEVTEVFNEAEWLQLIRTVSQAARVTIARRPDLSAAVTFRLAEIGNAAVVEALIENPEAPFEERVYRVVLDRFEETTAILDKLAERDDVGTSIALMLVEKVSDAVKRKLISTYDLGRAGNKLAEETDVMSVISVIQKLPAGRYTSVLRTLKSSGKLTPQLLMRTLGEDLLAFFGQALAFMSGSPRAVLPGEPAEAHRQFGAAGIPEAMHVQMWEELVGAVARSQQENGDRRS